ncbi:hypothetical protein EDD17DRAFT_867900 [Pisolithus thermaeus]|nr:hypothetical protein EDD17DRAFT_867900 [Pisolithus thermaeus]
MHLKFVQVLWEIVNVLPHNLCPMLPSMHTVTSGCATYPSHYTVISPQTPSCWSILPSLLKGSRQAGLTNEHECPYRTVYDLRVQQAFMFASDAQLEIGPVPVRDTLIITVDAAPASGGPGRSHVLDSDRCTVWIRYPLAERRWSAEESFEKMLVERAVTCDSELHLRQRTASTSM